MPRLIRLYIVNVAIGFGISATFVAMLVGFDLGGLQGLILGSPMGLVAAAMLWVANGIIFAGAQFAIAVMRMADEGEGPRGGLRQHAALVPVPVAAPARPGRGPAKLR
jgi:uncharacterized membrane protein